MDEEQENYSTENETEIKPKRVLTEAQKLQLAQARVKAIEMRKLRAEERKVEKENTKIDNKISEMEKKKEIMKLQQMAVEQNLEIDIKPKAKAKPKSPDPEPEPVKPSPPSPKVTEPASPPQSDFKWVNGRLMFFE